MRLSLHSVILLLASSRAHAAKCFGGDGTDGSAELKAAVNKYAANNWTADDTATHGSIEDWCTKDVTNMASLFEGKTTFNANISKWDVSSVITMERMFLGAQQFNQDLSAWNVSSVTNMYNMFYQAYKFNQDLSAWNVSKVTTMRGMFYHARAFNQGISGWDVSKVTNMQWTFGGAHQFNQDLSGWNVSSVTDMFFMFYDARAFNQDISGWNVSKVTNMERMFSAALTFNQDLSAWDTSSVTNMHRMFDFASKFNQDLSGWDVSKVTNMEGMFNSASSFNQNLCAWKDKFPYSNANDIFLGSGCTFKTSPVEADQGPFCAGSVLDCSAYIDSWDLNYASLTTDFNMNSASEITLDYNIGKGRIHQVGVFKKGCKDAITPATVLNHTFSTSPSTTDSRLDDLKVLVDLDKNTIASSNIYDASTKNVAICLKVDLFSGSNVIKTDERDVAINLDFGNNFTAIADANLNQTSMGSNTDSTKVKDYIEACTCDGASTFNCNTDLLSPDDYLNVCIKSRSDEMEIDYLDELTMTSNDDGDKLVIVQNNNLADSTISSKTMVPLMNGVHVASVIPSNFFSYSATSSAKVTGVAYLKLKGSRRRLAVDVEMIAGHPKVLAAGSSRALQTESVGDQESAFAINVELKRNELGVDADANGATDAMMSGFIVVATVIGSAAAMMML